MRAKRNTQSTDDAQQWVPDDTIVAGGPTVSGKLLSDAEWQTIRDLAYFADGCVPPDVMALVQHIEALSAMNCRIDAGLEAAVAEIRRLREALEHIANPVKAFQDYADKEGRVLDGAMALRLRDDGGYLSGVAKDALAATKEAGNGSH